MRTFTSAEMCEWLGAVGDLAGAVAASAPLPELLELIARTACELTGYEASGVLLPDEDRRRLFISGASGLSQEYVTGVNERRTITLTSGPLSEGPSTRAFLTGQPVIIRDILAEPSFGPWAYLAHDYGYRALVAIPLLVDRQSAGTLNCYRTTVHEFSPEEVALLKTLANQAGTALRGSRLITSLTEERRLSEQSEAIHREFTEVALRAEGMQGVAEALARLLQRPVLVTDNEAVVVANAPYLGVQMASEPVSLPESVTGVTEVSSLNRVTAPVLLGRTPVARLWLSGRQADFTELDVRAIEHAALVCALEFLRQRTATDVEWSLRSDLLADLLAGASPESLAARAVSLGHDLKRAHTVVVATIDGPHGQSAERALLSAVRAVASRQEPRPLVSAVDHDVVTLWPVAVDDDDGPRSAADRIRASTGRGSTGDTVSVLIGHRCDRVDEARGAVGTARAALQLAKLRGKNRIVTLPDLGMYGLLLQLSDPRELVSFADHTLAPIRDHDQRKNARLVDTVRAYLDNGMSVARTAEALFIHQNTVGLRLKKVEELSGISMQQPESWLQFKVALMAEDVHGGASVPAAADAVRARRSGTSRPAEGGH